MSISSRFLIVFALGLAIGLAGRAQDYPKASEKATVSQTVSGTTIEVAYSRPSARGREIFGTTVKWGEVWTPGADSATTFELSRDVRMAGEKVAAGRYSVWAIPGETEWTVMLHENADLFHTQKPKPEECRYKLTVKPRKAEHVESLAFYFSELGPRETTLNIHWGETAVGLPIRTNRAAIEKMSHEDAARIAGRYDTKLGEPGQKPIEATFTIVVVEGMLMGYMRTSQSFQLLPTAAENEFLLAGLRNGEIVNVEEEPMVFHFGAEGRATGFEYQEKRSGFTVTGQRAD